MRLRVTYSFRNQVQLVVTHDVQTMLGICTFKSFVSHVVSSINQHDEV